MTITLNSSQIQQNFGAALERALRGEDVIVERYGAPKAALVGFERYQRLLTTSQEPTGQSGQDAAPATQLREPAAIYQAGERTPASAPTYRYITQAPDSQRGRPIIRGSGTPVQAIAGYHRRGLNADQIVAVMPHLTLAQVYEALSYYYDHKEEIERGIENERAAPSAARVETPGSRLLGELTAALSALPSLGAAEAADFAADMAEARAQLPPLDPGHPWAS